MSNKKLLDKINKLKTRRATSGGGGDFSKLRGLFHNWQDGDNIIRLVDEFLETHSHFIAPAKNRGDRGLCQEDAFKAEGSDRLQKVVNCLNWDLKTESELPKSEHTCPVCRLYSISCQVLDEKPDDPEEKKFYENLRSACRPRVQLKWNVIDRDNPNIKKIDGDAEVMVPGLKIASIGVEAWDDIEGIFEQVGADITDPEKGIDICVVKSFDHKKKRITYSAKAIIQGTSLKVTPLTEEEMAFERHDLLALSGRMTDADKIVDALHGDLRDILSLDEDEEDESPAESPAPKAEVPAEKPAPKRPTPAPVEETGGDDEDDPLAGTDDNSAQKKS